MGVLDTISIAEMAARTGHYGYDTGSLSLSLSLSLSTATAAGMATFPLAGALDDHMEGTTPAGCRRNCKMGLNHAYSRGQT